MLEESGKKANETELMSAGRKCFEYVRGTRFVCDKCGYRTKTIPLTSKYALEIGATFELLKATLGSFKVLNTSAPVV